MTNVYESFSESEYSRGFEVDRENKILKGVRVLGMHSKNDGGNREYSESAVHNGLRLYDSKPGFLSHKSGRSSRDFSEKLGIHRNPRRASADNPGIITDFHLNPHHPMCESILWEAEQPDSDVGFSHVAEGRAVKKNGKIIVEEIATVSSIDLVCNPATVKNFREEVDAIDPMQKEFCEHGFSALSDATSILRSSESVDSKTQKLMEVLAVWTAELSKSPVNKGAKAMDWSDITVSSLQENRKDLWDKITGNDALSQSESNVKRLTAELDATKASLKEAADQLAKIAADHEKNTKLMAVKEELKKAGVISDKICTESAINQLCAINDPESRKVIVDIMVIAQKSLNESAIRSGSAPFASVQESDLDPDDPRRQEAGVVKRWR